MKILLRTGVDAHDIMDGTDYVFDTLEGAERRCDGCGRSLTGGDEFYSNYMSAMDAENGWFQYCPDCVCILDSEEIIERLQGKKWIDASAQQPNIGELVWIHERQYHGVDIGYWDSIFWNHWTGSDDVYVTHWMPLIHPDAPVIPSRERDGS